MIVAHRVLAATALVVALGATGCSGDANQTSPTSAVGSTEPSASPEATPREATLDTSDAEDQPHEELTPEPTSAGPLDSEDMPEPVVLGPGWAFDVVDGDPHVEGFVGNDAATHRRDPAEVAALSVPFGCKQRSATELRAVHVLDATYDDGLRRAVALRMRFDSARTAARFLSARHDDLVACAAKTMGYDGRSTVSKVGRVQGSTVSRRSEPGVPGHWSEVAMDAGRGDVVLVALPDLSPKATTELARRLNEADI
jgi:hypothetical protein